MYACPTVEANTGGAWFTKGYAHLSRNHPVNENPWPPLEPFGTYMTYGKRRMLNYDNPNLSYFHYKHPRPRPNEHIMMWSTGVGEIQNPARFSFMADRFITGEWAMVAHVPGVNVLYRDGHVAYWADPTWDQEEGTGKVLYDNGITSWSADVNNWKHDDIWMIIDGYHDPPVGQGK
jgi:hypothetical protein